MKYIILKADDWGNGNQTNWEYFCNIILRKQIKATLGINAYNYDYYACVPLKQRIKEWIKTTFLFQKNQVKIHCDNFWKYTKQLVESGNFEIWNHSYRHIVMENLSNKEIKELIERNQKIVKRKLDGYVMCTFGAPENKISETIKRYLETQPEIKSWLYGIPDCKMPMVLIREINIETPVCVANFEAFRNKYDEVLANSKHDYFCIQLHPHTYNNKMFTELEQFLDFMLAQGHKFVTIREYFEINSKNL